MDTGVEQSKDFYKAEPQGLSGGPWASAAKHNTCTQNTPKGGPLQARNISLTLLP